MAKKRKKTAERCVHCLRSPDVGEGDHVFPDSWYPDSTPSTVQRWTVPSCSRCNREFGRAEQDLLIRLILCVDPKSEAAAGLTSKAMRSLGIDTAGLPEKERAIREGLRKKISAEMIPRNELEGKPGAIPGLGPPAGVDSKWAIPIPYGVLSMIAEKIARGCEWNLKKRYVEDPYAVITFIRKCKIAYPHYASHLVEHLDFGPGCRIQRLSVPEEPNIVRYSITIWNALNLEAIVDLRDEIEKAEAAYSRPEGLDLSQMPTMRISPYLRDYQDHN